MTGKPKFKREQQVKFKMNDNGTERDLDGVIYVVDANGVEDCPGEPCYDIEAVCDGEILLFKHVVESLVSER